ncbi:MAG: hypothetical protein EF811_02200 [Methanonatronarchaeia archaeon]|nr:MAG: hypothetical protein EF811_02200 [Methanonatronarchaeia archaeon]
MKKKTGRAAIKTGSALQKTRKTAKKQLGKIDDFGMKPSKPVYSKTKKKSKKVPRVDLGTGDSTDFGDFKVDVGKKKKKKNKEFDIDIF